MGKTSDILRQLADMIDDGCFEHLSEDDLDGAKRWKEAVTVNVAVIPDRVAEVTACVNRGKKTMTTTMITANVAVSAERVRIPGTDAGRLWTGWILMSAFRKE